MCGPYSRARSPARYGLKVLAALIYQEKKEPDTKYQPRSWLASPVSLSTGRRLIVLVLARPGENPSVLRGRRRVLAATKDGSAAPKPVVQSYAQAVAGRLKWTGRAGALITKVPALLALLAQLRPPAQRKTEYPHPEPTPAQRASPGQNQHDAYSSQTGQT